MEFPWLSEGAMTLSAGARLGPYEIVSLIGVGGMGEVYTARDTRFDRTVAVKVLLNGLRSIDRIGGADSRPRRAQSRRSIIRTSARYSMLASRTACLPRNGIPGR